MPWLSWLLCQVAWWRAAGGSACGGPGRNVGDESRARAVGGMLRMSNGSRGGSVVFSDGALMRSALWLACADVRGVWVRLESVVQVQGSPSRKVWGSNATSDLNQAEADHHIHSLTNGIVPLK